MREVFDEESANQLRRGLDPFRTPGAYEEGKWWVALHSRSPEVLKDAPATVSIRDITMRTVEQMAGVSMSKEKRHRLLQAIVATGVPEVMSTSSYLGIRGGAEVREDMDLIRATSPECKIVFTTVRAPEDVTHAKAAGYDRVSIASNFIGEAAPLIDPRVYDRLWRNEDWSALRSAVTADQMVQRSVDLVAVAKDQGMPVGATINLVAKAPDDYVSTFCGAVGAAGADEIVFADGSSSMSPEAFAHAVHLAKEAAPAARIAVHTHDFLGLGLACALSSVLAGAECVEVAVNGYHLGYGQGDLAAVAVGLEALYGISTGIDLSQLTPLSRLAEELVGEPTSPTQPIVGRDSFVLGWTDPFLEENFVEPLLHKPITPALVGNAYHVAPTVSLGKFGLWRWLDELGIEASKQQMELVLEDCLATLHREDRRLTPEDVRAAVARVRDRGAVPSGERTA